MKTKAQLQASVLTGISSLFACKDGFTTAAAQTGTGKVLTLDETKMCEFPCSEDSGFSYNEGTPTTDGHKIHGLGVYWSSKMTPGDTAIAIEIPCHDTDILEFCGFTSVDLTATGTGTVFSGKTFTGKTFSGTRKAVILGLLALDDTEQNAFFVKKAKLMASVVFDGSNKPLCVALNGTIQGGADADALAVLAITPTPSGGD